MENEPVVAETVPADTVVNEPVPPFTVVPLIVGALTYPDLDILSYVIPVKDALRLVTSFMECVCEKSVMSDLTCVCPLNATALFPTFKEVNFPVDALTVPVNVAFAPLIVLALNVPEKLPLVLVMAVYVIPDNVVDRFVTSFIECV